MISEKNIEWLLETQNPSMRYRTLVDLLDTPINHPDVQQCKKRIYEYEPVKTLFKHMHPDGYWLQQHPKTKEILGNGVEYGAFA